MKYLSLFIMLLHVSSAYGINIDDILEKFSAKASNSFEKIKSKQLEELKKEKRETTKKLIDVRKQETKNFSEKEKMYYDAGVFPRSKAYRELDQAIDYLKKSIISADLYTCLHTYYKEISLKISETSKKPSSLTILALNMQKILKKYSYSIDEIKQDIFYSKIKHYLRSNSLLQKNLIKILVEEKILLPQKAFYTHVETLAFLFRSALFYRLSNKFIRMYRESLDGLPGGDRNVYGQYRIRARNAADKYKKEFEDILKQLIPPSQQDTATSSPKKIPELQGMRTRS